MGTLGRTDTGNSSGSISANYKYASKFTLGSTLVVARGHVYFSGQAKDAKIRMVIYSVTSGNPDALLATSNEVVGIASNVWTDFTFSPITLEPADYYIGYIIDTATVTLRTQSSGGTSRWNADTYSDGAANPFGSATSGSNEGCLYVEDAAPDSTILGISTPGASSGTVNADYKFVSRFTIFGATLTLNAGHIITHSDCVSRPSAKIKMVVYSYAGAAATLIAESTEKIGWAAGVQQLDFVFSEFSLGPGDYLLGYICDTSSFYIPLTSQGASIYKSDTYSDGPSDPFGTPAFIQSVVGCMWADLISSVGTLTKTLDAVTLSAEGTVVSTSIQQPMVAIIT